MWRKNKAKKINDAIEFFGVTFLARVVANYTKWNGLSLWQGFNHYCIDFLIITRYHEKGLVYVKIRHEVTWIVSKMKKKR
jgi:hypothetical protein